MIDFIPKIEYGSPPIEVNFDFPPKGRDPLGRQLRMRGKTQKSVNGLTQTTVDYIEETFGATFTDLDKDKVQELEDFYLDHAILGKEFKYFPDKLKPSNYFTVELSKMDFKPKGMLADPENEDFLYDVTIKMRRVRA